MLTQTRPDTGATDLADLGEQLSALPSRLAVRILAHTKRRDARQRNRLRVRIADLDLDEQLNQQ